MATTDDKSLFNIDFLILQPEQLKYMQEVTSLAVFESNSQVFDKKGFFSTEIFGPIGSKERLERPGYIDIKIPVLHPLVYKYLISLDAMFDKVLSSKIKVKLVDGKFVEDSQGSTGFEFFMQNIDKLDFVRNDSKRRDDKILLVQRGILRKNWIQHILILPAGLRDYVIDKKGKPSSDEINDYYRKLLISTNVVRNIKITPSNYDKFDNYRYKIQNIFLDIFEKFKNYLDGKTGFIQGRWASRAIMGGTRNVLTADMHIVKDLKDKTNGNVINESVCGIYQFIKATPDISAYHVNKNFILGVINPTTNNAKVISSKTLKTEFKSISSKDKSDWITRDGLNNIFNKMKQDIIKDEPAKIGEDYIALVEDTGKTITVIKDTNNIPSGVNASKLRPITYAELFYISVYEVSKEIKAMVTRYPIQQIGSTYPASIYLSTTAPARRVTVNIDGRSIDMEEYPILGNKYMNSVSTNATHLKRLGGDHDGDCSLGLCIYRLLEKSSESDIIDNSDKEQNMPINSKHVVYKNMLVNLRDFPKGELIETKGNTDYYRVPDGIEVLTVWNNEYEWVHPESYSVHRDLNMLQVKTKSGSTIEISDDHSIVTVDSDLNYVRANPEIGMTIPKIKNVCSNKYINKDNLKYTINSDNTEFNVNFDLGYLFGAVIGDGWINHTGTHLNDIMIATIHDGIVNKVTDVLKNYGYEGKPYTKENPHTFEGRECFSKKHTWNFKPVANLLRKHIGHMAKNKQLPSFWLSTPEGFRWGLLSGLIDTDGTIATTPKEHDYRVAYSTTSDTLAYEIQALANSLDLNVYTTICRRVFPNRITVEYTLSFTKRAINKLKENIKLFNSKKQTRLADFEPIKTEQDMMFTPMIDVNRVKELQAYIKSEQTELYTRIKAIADKPNSMNKCVLPRSLVLEAICKYPLFFKDGFWNRYKTMVEDENIEWEVIKNITPLPFLTEAYDLTVPPFCTFVLQNGIVVYDTVSFTPIYSKESRMEIEDLLKSKSYYITPNGDFSYSVKTDTLEYVLKSLTK